MNCPLCSLGRWLPALAVFATVCFFGGCANFEPGTPVAAITVRANSNFEVMDAVERVFNAAGYRIKGRTYNSVTFEKTGSRPTKSSWENGMGNAEVARAALVTVVEMGRQVSDPCTPQIVRNRGQGDFEDTHRTAQVVSFHYSGLLREVRRELR